VLAIVRGSPTDSLAAVESLSSADYEELRQTALASLVEPSLAPTLARVVYEMGDARHPVRQREVGWRFWVNLIEVWRGRPAAARAALDTAEALGTDLRGVAYQRLIQLAHGMGDTTRASDALAMGRETGLFHTPMGRWALGVYYLRDDQLTEVAASAAALDVIGDSLLSVGDSAEAVRARGLGQGLRGMLAGRRGEFEDAVTILRSSVLQSSGLGDAWVAAGDQRLALAIALAELGREEESLEVLEAGFDGYAYDDVPAALLRGQLYERRGEREQAILAYSRVVEL
jgi:tetratricopeptide (TPR) repeat protein